MDYPVSKFGLLCAFLGCFVAPSGAFLELTANLDKKRSEDRVEMRQLIFNTLVHRVEQPKLS